MIVGVDATKIRYTNGDIPRYTATIMRLLTFLAYCGFIFGAVGIAAGRYFALPKGVYVGISLIGIGFLIGAFDALYNRQMSLRASNEASQAYAGTPAVVWGAMLLLIGGVIVVSAYMLDAGQWYAMLNRLKQRPGLLYVGGGFLAAGLGVLAFVNPHGRRVWWKTLLLRMPRVLMATILLIGGLAAIGLGVWEMLEPRGFARFSQGAIARLDFRSMGGFVNSVLALLR